MEQRAPCDKMTVAHSMSRADFKSVVQVIEKVAPEEIYNLSGQSSVSLSFTQPAETLAGIALGTLNMLESLRRLGGECAFIMRVLPSALAIPARARPMSRLRFGRRALMA